MVDIALRFSGLHCAHIGAFDVSYESSSPAQANLDGVLTECLAGGVGEYDMLAPNSAYKNRIADRRTRRMRLRCCDEPAGTSPRSAPLNGGPGYGKERGR